MAGDGDVLEVAITGEGVSPANVPIRVLSELLAATSAALEAAAHELSVTTPLAALFGIVPGSAAFKIATPPAPADVSPVHVFYEAARVRGQGYPSAVKKAIQRVHDAGVIGAGIRISIQGTEPRPPIMLASVVDEAGTYLEELDEVYGRIVAVVMSRTGPTVKIKLDGGGTPAFTADTQVALHAAQLWNQSVRARVTFRRSSLGDEEPCALEEIGPWTEASFFDAIDGLRGDIADSGVKVNADDWTEHEGE